MVLDDLLIKLIVEGGIGLFAVYVLFKAIQWQRDDRKDMNAVMLQILGLQTNFNTALQSLEKAIQANTVMDGDKLKAIRTNSEDIQRLQTGILASMNKLEDHVTITSDKATTQLVSEITKVLANLESVKQHASEHAAATVRQQTDLIARVDLARDTILERLNIFVQSQPARVMTEIPKKEEVVS